MHRADRVHKHIDRGLVGKEDTVGDILGASRADRLVIKAYEKHLSQQASMFVAGKIDQVSDIGIVFADEETLKLIHGAAEIALRVEADYAKQAVSFGKGEECDVDDYPDDEDDE